MKPVRAHLLIATAVGGAVIAAVIAAIAFSSSGTGGATVVVPESKVAVDPERSELLAAARTCPDRRAELVAHTECLGDTLIGVARRDGLGAVLGELSAMANADRNNASVCHGAAHYTGRVLAGADDRLGDVVAVDDGTCDFGLTHGAVEGYAQGVDEARFTSEVGSLCTALADGIRRQNCVHGIGHGITLRYNDPVKGLLARCANLLQVDRGGCVSAIVMAYTNDSRSLSAEVHVSIDRLTPEELSVVCDQADPAVAAACWQLVWELAGGTLDVAADPEMYLAVVGELCEHATTRGYGAECTKGYGQALLFRVEVPDGPEPDQLYEAAAAALSRCPGQAPALTWCVSGVSSGAGAWWAATNDSFDEYRSPCGTLDGESGTTCRREEEFWREQLASLGR
jgi:hypothetical protein